MRLLFALAITTLAVAACGDDVDLGGASGGDDAGQPAIDARDDGTPAIACGTLSPPSVPSQCRACRPGVGDCQPNGCFNGFYCDNVKRDCSPPPASCPDAGHADTGP
jgi:hypothetical protein